MWYDRYDEDDLDNHHPTCKGPCGQLADECMCTWPLTGTYDPDRVLSVEVHGEQEEDHGLDTRGY